MSGIGIGIPLSSNESYPYKMEGAGRKAYVGLKSGYGRFVGSGCMV